MEYEVQWKPVDGIARSYPVIVGDRRPPHVLIEHDVFAGERFLLAKDLEENYVLMAGTDLWVPARQLFVAIGGDLIFDVVLDVGFDGRRSWLREVAFRERPDFDVHVSSTLIRKIRLDPLVRRPLSEKRNPYR